MTTAADVRLTEHQARRILDKMPRYYGSGSFAKAEPVASALDLVGSVAMGNMSLDEAAESVAHATSGCTNPEYAQAFRAAFDAAVGMLKAAR